MQLSVILSGSFSCLLEEQQATHGDVYILYRGGICQETSLTIGFESGGQGDNACEKQLAQTP